MSAGHYRFFPEQDVSLHDLNPPEQFLLWAIRIWVRIAVHPQKARDVMERAFSQVGAPEGGQQFHRLMMALTSSATRRISIRCPRSFAVLEDECGLLEILILAQSGHDGLAHQALSAYVGTEGVETALAHAKALMCTCLEGGIALRQLSGLDDMKKGVPPRAVHDAALRHQGNQTLH